MMQQIIALIIIGFFLVRLIVQKKRKVINSSEYKFWLVFWLLSMAAIIFLKPLDRAAAQLGFSASGIEVLLYLSVVLLFYFLIRVRLRLERTEKNITRITRHLALSDPDERKNNAANSRDTAIAGNKPIARS